MKISRKRLNESYKLRFYCKQEGPNQGDLDHEEFFDTRVEAINRYEEVFDRNAYSLNPTMWVGDGDNWKRLSEVEINESLKEDFEDYEDRLFYRKSDRLENSVEKRFPGWKIFVEGSWQSGIGSDFIYIYPPDNIELEDDDDLSIYLNGSFLDISNREILKLIAQKITPVIQANESLNEALSDEAKANNEMIQRILNKKPSQLTAKEKKFLADNDLVRYDGTGGYHPNIRKNGDSWSSGIGKGDSFIINRNNLATNIDDVDQLNLLKKRDERSRARYEADKDPDILEPQNIPGLQGKSKLQVFNKNYEKDIKGSKRYAKNARDFMDSYIETGSRLKADLAKHSANISRVLKDQAKKSLEHRPKFESFGGAFDIEDDMFFTKDDLMEFAYELEDKFREWSKDPNAEISDVYMTTPTHLVMEIMSDGAGHEAQVDIDMRRIRSPRNIDKYGDQILAQWKDSFIQYNGDPNEVLDESYDESTIEDYFNDVWDKYSELRDALYAFENAVQGNKDLEIAANSFITNIEEAAGDFWSDYDYYLNSEDEIEEEE